MGRIEPRRQKFAQKACSPSKSHPSAREQKQQASLGVTGPRPYIVEGCVQLGRWDSSSVNGSDTY